MRPSTLCLLAALLAPVAASHAQAPKRGITAEDYFQFELVSDPHVSPNGSHVVYVVQRVDRASNKRVPSVWIVPSDGSAPAKQLLDESWSPGAPRWMPDGATIAFTSSHADGARGAAPVRAQLWMVAASGGTPKRVTSVMNGVSGCTIAPNGKLAACLSRTGPSDKWPAGKERSDVRHYSHLSYKFNDTGWYDDRRSHIWVVDLSSGEATTDHVRRRLERHRSAVVADQRAHRVRLQPHGAGARRRSQLRRLDDRSRRRRAGESLAGRRPGQPAALVARWRLDRVHHLARRGRAAAARHRSRVRRRAHDAGPGPGSRPNRSHVGDGRRDLLRHGRERRIPRLQGRSRVACAHAGDIRTARRALAESLGERKDDGVSGERLHPPRRRLRGAGRRKGREEAFEPQRGAGVTGDAHARRADDLQGRRRLGRRRLFGQAARLASRKEVSDGAEHPRRAGGPVRRRLVPRVPGLLVAWLGGVLHESARLDRLRPHIRARHRAELGRQGLRRHHERRERRRSPRTRGSTPPGWASPAEATAAT